MQHDPRRTSPRIGVEALCWEVIGDHEVSGLVVDLSSEGARLERPFVGGRIEREVPIQLEVPGIDEVMWARGEVVFDQLVPARAADWSASSPRNGGQTAGPFGLLRRTGYRIVLAAARDLRMLREFVHEMHRGTIESLDSLMLASCYGRG